jgi:hypothetical protein
LLSHEEISTFGTPLSPAFTDGTISGTVNPSDWLVMSPMTITLIGSADVLAASAGTTPVASAHAVAAATAPTANRRIERRPIVFPQKVRRKAVNGVDGGQYQLVPSAPL